jgi:cytochrome P450
MAVIAPGPPGHWLLGQLVEQRRDPLGILMRGRAAYGDVVRFRFGPYAALLVASPSGIRRIFVDNPRGYEKWGALRRLEAVLGRGLLLAEGEAWQRKRRIYQPALHRLRLQAMLDDMTGVTRDLIAAWQALPDGAPVDVLDWTMRLALAIVARTLLSRDLGGLSRHSNSENDELTRLFDFLTEEAGERILSMDPTRGLRPTLRNLRFQLALRKINTMVMRLIRARRRAPGSAHDLLAMLMEVEDEATGTRMDDRELRDEVVTTLLTGRGTTAVGLTWMFYLLDRHRDVAAKVRAEIDAVLGDRVPTLDDLPKLELTTRVFQETLRLYPPSWMLTRQALAPDEIDGYRVDPGTAILISPYVLHHNPRVWEEPTRFDPDRFLPERAAGRSDYAYLPFGVGPRVCVGKSFAMMEAKIAAAMLLRRFDFTVPVGTPVEPKPLVTLKPHPALMMRLSHRAPPAADRAKELS